MNNTFLKISEIYQNGFRQTSDATCGPASVILVAMGLGLKAEKEATWRDNRFAQWMPVSQFLHRGMALHELQFISEMIYEAQLDITLKRAYPEHLPKFSKDIKESITSQASVIIVNYKQDDFIKTNNYCEQGNPHYSPIVGFNPRKDEILIADVDPEVKKPYWVPLTAMFQSMAKINPAFGKPRGWLTLKKLGRKQKNI